MGVNGNAFKLLLLLHIACVVLGFGAVAFNGLYRARARHHGGVGEAAALDANAEVSRAAEFLIYAVFVLGILVAVTSKPSHGVMVDKFSQAWLSIAMVLYLLDLGVLHGLVRRSEKQYATLLASVNAAPVTTAGPPAEVARLDHLEQRIRFGWMLFDVIFLVVLYLMVFTPGR